ncbi:uncharacterized protein LOC131934166 [Physella acuta]|uniref:uncharacterized protein LOC131934166 n=1 Tax=Physella acuta TaxID=109671 RepID=UPI0027DB1CA3|nr:uncharacterized protein LOC131934166 [Physella acuta]
MKLALISFFLATLSGVQPTTRRAPAANTGTATYNQLLLSNFIEMITGDFEDRRYIYPNGTTRIMEANCRFLPVDATALRTPGTVLFHYAEDNDNYFRHSLHGVSINDGGRIIVKNYRFIDRNFSNNSLLVASEYFQDTLTADMVENFPHCDNVFSRDEYRTDAFVVSFAVCPLDDAHPKDPPYLTGVFNCTGLHLTHPDLTVFKMDKSPWRFTAFPSYVNTYRKNPKPCGRT